MLVVDALRRCGVQYPGKLVEEWDDADWGEGSDVVVAVEGACDLENPESCESCQ